MVVKLTHTAGDVEFVRVVDVEVGQDEATVVGQLAYTVTLMLEDGGMDYIRDVEAVERMPDTPFSFVHVGNPMPYGFYQGEDDTLDDSFDAWDVDAPEEE